MKHTQETLIRAVEEMADDSGVTNVLFALARMCNEKAEHLRVNWQDENAAKAWDRAARAIDRFTTHACITTISGQS